MVFLTDRLTKDPEKIKANIVANLERLTKLNSHVRSLNIMGRLPDLINELINYKDKKQRTPDREGEIAVLIDEILKDINKQETKEFIEFGELEEATIFKLEYEVSKYVRLEGTTDEFVNILIDKYNQIINYFERMRKAIHHIRSVLKDLQNHIKKKEWPAVANKLVIEGYPALLSGYRNDVVSNLSNINKMQIEAEKLMKERMGMKF